MDATDKQGKAEGSPYRRHLPALDGVRGLAIAGVMASHLFPGNAAPGWQRAVQWSFLFGAHGVDLFFVLSGLLITGILFDTRDDPHFFRKFYARRALRIFPLYYGVLLVFAMVGLATSAPVWRELLSLGLYLQNTRWIAPPIEVYPANLLPLGHLWSLAIEEQFYLVWPLLVFLLRRRLRLLALCGAAVAALPLLRLLLLRQGMDPMSVHVNTALRADSLLCGGALALLLRGRWHDRTLRAAPWVLSLGVFALAATQIPWVPAMSRPALLLLEASSYSVTSIAAVGLLAMTLRPGRTQRIFSHRWLRTLGRYSYGLYVLHVLVLRYAQAPLKRLAEAAHLGKGLGVLLTGAVALLLSLAAAWLSYNLYERQFLRLKRYVDYRAHPDTVVR